MKTFITLVTCVVFSISCYAGEPIGQADAIAIAKKKYSRRITSPFGVAYSATPVDNGWNVKIQRILDYNQAAKRPVYDIFTTHVFVSSSGQIHNQENK